LLFERDAERAAYFPEVLSHIRKLEEARRSAALYRAQPDFTCFRDFREIGARIDFYQGTLANTLRVI
jgi:hypothetical protein